MNQSRKMYSMLCKVLFVTFLVLGMASSVMAQVSASIVGRVEDSSGAGIPGAVVSVTNEETAETRIATIDDSGNYRVLSLPVGRYNIKAEKTGFNAVVQSGVDLTVGQQAVVNLTLQIGSLKQQVVVSETTNLVNTSTDSISGLVGEKAVKELPLNGRSFDMLITLNAGATNITSQKGTGAGAQSGNLFSVSGRRASENLFLLNGVEYTGPSQLHSIPGGVSGQLLGIDAVREFNVVSDTYGADYGKRAGAQVSIVTQSGSNEVHGSGFEFLRNSVLDAKNYFDHPIGERIPPFKRNQFGGAIGAPIQKDKTFIFANYEGFRQELGISDVTVVPDANARLGMLPCGNITPLPSGCTGTTDTTPAPVPNLNQAMLPYMIFWPTANGPEIGAGAAFSFSNPPQSIREDFGTVRLDHVFSPKDQSSASYMVDDGYNLTPAQDPVSGATLTLRSQVLSLQETHIFSSAFVNNVTVGFSRAAFHYLNPALTDIPSDLYFVPGNLLGRISIGGSGIGGSSTITLAGGTLTPSSISYRNTFDYQDQVQIVKGHHLITAGVSFQQLQSNDYTHRTGGGVAAFTNLQTFLQGTVSNYQVQTLFTPHYWRQLEGAWYVQDAIQLRKNLSLRVGLRHEFTNGWNDAAGRASNFVYAGGVTTQVPGSALVTAPVVGDSVYTVNNSKFLFSPRVGLAWDPFGNGKTSVRAGFGTYYDIADELGFDLNSLAPFNNVATFANVPFLSVVPFNPSIPVPPPCDAGVPTPCTTLSSGGVQSDIKTPTIEEWNLTVEQQITPNTLLSVAYVGSHGFHQWSNTNGNSVATQICANAAGCTSGGVGTAHGTVPEGASYLPVQKRPNPFLAGGNMFVSNDDSSYNALNVEVTRRFVSGLQFKGAYTWSRDLDFQSGFSNGDNSNEASGMEDPYNPKLDWGPSAQNATHRLAFSGSYELPFGRNKMWLNGVSGVADKLASGWQVNWIETIRSGFPFSVLTGSNRSGNGDSNNPDRPSLNPAFTGPIVTGNPQQWFNPNAFILPTAGTYGNVSRNSLVGPGLAELDLSLFKTTRFNERLSCQFRAEAFNVLNRANFYNPSLNVFSGSAISPTAGLITSTATTSRQIQFGLKLMF